MADGKPERSESDGEEFEGEDQETLADFEQFKKWVAENGPVPKKDGKEPVTTPVAPLPPSDALGNSVKH